MLSKVLQKLHEDQAEGVLSTIVEDSNLVPKNATHANVTTCTSPQRQERVAVAHNRTVTHPLWPKLRLMACFLSGDDSKCKTFQRDLAKLSYHHGEKEPQSNTEFIWISGRNMPHREIKIPVHQL